MATMFPENQETFATAGEENVYRFLQRAARPDSVWLAWYSPDINDREPDFILFSPEIGLIVLEVKDWVIGQIIELDPKNALLDIGGRRERRKQPMSQAREYVHGLLSLLRKNARKTIDGKPDAGVPVLCAAVFPHITREEFKKHGLDKVIDADRVLFWDEINDFSPFFQDPSGKLFQEWMRSHFPPMFPFSCEKRDLDWLRSCIFPVARLELPRKTVLREDALVLDQDQENLARTFGPGKILISGCAGSGKTIILAHMAWHLPRVDKSIKRILITCFNLSLVGYIRRLLSRKGVPMGANGVEVIPFFNLCERILGENLVHSGEEGDYYSLVTRESLERLSGEHELKGAWDAVLVDEGQDFSPEMAAVLEAIAPKARAFVVAQDDNQRLYQKNDAHWEKMGPFRRRVLSRQYRNSRAIGQLAAKVPGARQNVVHAGADGPEPVWIFRENPEALIREIADRVGELARSGEAMNEVAILYVRSGHGNTCNIPSLLLEALEARGVLARWAARDESSKRDYDITTDSVTVSTIHSVKGLDFAHVFLLGLETLDPGKDRDARLAYVAITRARESLCICAADESGMVGTLLENTRCFHIHRKMRSPDS